jgi:AhpD family alkylhydroperoxidase
MPHIQLPEGLQGIRGPMAFRPETAKPLNELAEVLLHAPNSLTPGERELIATYVSSLNDCYFCQTVHGAIASAHLNDDEDLVRRVKADFKHADISEKLKALLVVAGKVQKGGKHVTATSKSTMLCSSQRHSACTTAMSMDLRPGSPKTRNSIASAARRPRKRAM